MGAKVFSETGTMTVFGIGGWVSGWVPWAQAGTDFALQGPMLALRVPHPLRALTLSRNSSGALLAHCESDLPITGVSKSKKNMALFRWDHSTHKGKKGQKVSSRLPF